MSDPRVDAMERTGGVYDQVRQVARIAGSLGHVEIEHRLIAALGAYDRAAADVDPVLARAIGTVLQRATDAEIIDFCAAAEDGSGSARAIRERFDCSAARFWQRVNRILDDPRALTYDPVVVGRLRARRDRLRALRTPGVVDVPRAHPRQGRLEVGA